MDKSDVFGFWRNLIIEEIEDPESAEKLLSMTTKSIKSEVSKMSIFMIMFSMLTTLGLNVYTCQNVRSDEQQDKVAEMKIANKRIDVVKLVGKFNHSLFPVLLLFICSLHGISIK